ncbi:type II/IV secretion system protein [Candidatus Saccharibacteria bacterium]|nr:type II/IV secretion system protein [Candidatus Saccharibacteria bacterium]
MDQINQNQSNQPTNNQPETQVSSGTKDHRTNTAGGVTIAEAQNTKLQTEKYIKQSLVRDQKLNAQQLASIEHLIKLHNIDFIDYLISQNVADKEYIGQAVARYYGLNYIDLDSNQPLKELVMLVPKNVTAENRVVYYYKDSARAIFVTDQPKQPGLKEKLAQYIGGLRFELAYSLSEDIDVVLARYRTPLATRFNQIIQQQDRVAPDIIDEIVKDALVLDVSDIHLEPEESVVLIRFRIDGVLREAGQLPLKYYDSILNRLKVQAKMPIDVHGASQDGAIRYSIDEVSVDIRISIVPTLNGETVALRLLAGNSKNLNFKNLGFNVFDLRLINQQIHRPFGMIVTTGPTGSGKTTTLYSMLKLLNSSDINITTIEDPVEYKLFGINQIQVNRATGLNFAEGLRTIVRQDPDIILVGEIRDRETAKMAVNAALTGHLLFSTFHANDSATAIPRFIDMGVEPFLLASTLNTVIAQRLMRTICKICTKSFVADIDQLKKRIPNAERYFHKPKVTLYYGEGCESCNYSGYKGRVAIYEILIVSPSIKELIVKNPSSRLIWEQAQKEGARTLFEDGIVKVLNGRSTLEELLRVAEPK